MIYNEQIQSFHENGGKISVSDGFLRDNDRIW